MTCKYCAKSFSCGCQKTSAFDGSIVHKTCLSQYNAKLNGPPKSGSTHTVKENVNRVNNILNR